MFEGKDRAMRERAKVDEELKQSMVRDSIKLTTDKVTKGIDENSEKEDEQSGFINNSDIQYLPFISLRKRKIEDHIYLVTSDILNTFRPSNKSYKTEFPLTLHLNKDQLNNIKKEWANYKIDPNIEKVNLNIIQSTVPIDHPYRNMLFKFIPKNKEITWNECSPSPDQESKKFVEFLQSEYSVDNCHSAEWPIICCFPSPTELSLKFVCLSVCLFVLFVCLSVCLFVCHHK